MKNNKIIIKINIYLFIIIIAFPFKVYSSICSYKVTNYYTEDNSKNIYFITREFIEDNIEKVLAINIKTFETLILHKDMLNLIKLYKKPLLNKFFLKNPIKYDKNCKNNIYLTVDLCPCIKAGFEKDFFEKLINYGKKHNKTINIAIAITAKWAIKHPKELNLLKNWNNNKDLIITWINHGYTHFYNCNFPIDKNFMLHDINNCYDEIINNEIYMLENNLIPSVFFRFPGLVYNKELLYNINKNLHLIVLDSNVWLAKNKDINDIQPGSIILLHGNKNEPLGIKIFLKLLNTGVFDKYNFTNINNILQDYK